VARLTWTSGDKATPWREVDGDAPAYAATLERVLRLIGYVYDVATGSNSPADTPDGSGDGAGCPPGVGVNAEAWSHQQGHGYLSTELAALYMLPVWVPPGETSLHVEVDTVEFTLPPLRAELLDSSSGAVDEAIALDDGRGVFDGLPSAGTLYVLRVYDNVQDGERSYRGALRLHYGRLAPSRAGDPTTGIRTGATAIPVPTSTSGSAEIDDVTDIDDAWVGEEMPVCSYPLTVASRNLAVLDEMILGRPAYGANADYTLEADASSEPFLTGSRTVHAAEPTYSLMLWAVGVGVGPYDGAAGSALGKMTDEDYTYGCLSSSTGTSQLREVLRVPTQMPDLDGTLHVASLWASPDSAIGSGDYTVRHAAAGNAETSSVTELTSHYRLADTTPSYTAGDIEDIVISYHTATLKGDGSDLRFVGAAAWIEGS